jgi:hypothetical protein
VAEFGWRLDRARQLSAGNRETIDQNLRRRHPALNGMDQAGRCRWLGEKTGLSASAVARSLYGEESKEQDFVKSTYVLQRLAALLKRKE